MRVDPLGRRAPAAAPLLAATLLALGCGGCCPCASSAPAATPGREGGRLFGPRELESALGSAQLRERVRRDVHAFFRLVNRGFTNAVCRRFGETIPATPVVNLHGDVHLEQYAVTETGRGLADFDDAALGPPMVDLVRAGTSAVLVAQSHGWDPAPAVQALLDGYRESLEHPRTAVTEPPLCGRLREELPTRPVFLARSEDLMTPLEPALAEEFDRAFARYVGLMDQQHPELRAGYFEVKRRGRVRAGVGSTLVPRILVRVEGPTDEADDDVILEVKELVPFEPGSCVRRMGGAWRVVLTQARLGLGSNELLAVVPRSPAHPFGGHPFWIQEWRPDYRELDVERDLRRPEELVAVAHDVGHRLGTGHVLYVGAPLDEQLRLALRSALEVLAPRIRRQSIELAEITRRDWQAFLERVGR